MKPITCLPFRRAKRKAGWGTYFARFLLALPVLNTGSGSLAADAQTGRPELSWREQTAQRAGYRQTDAGLDYSRWSKLIGETNASLGRVVYRTNSFTVLEAGKNRWDGTNWVPSSVKVGLSNGWVAVSGVSHEALLAGNLNSLAAVRIRVPEIEGGWLKAGVLALAYETATSHVVIGTVQDCTAQLSSRDPRSVLYTNAFRCSLASGTVDASVRYDFSAGGLAQSVLIHALPTLADAGLNEADEAEAKLVIITELFDAPTPTIQQREWNVGKNQFRDQLLSFGGSMAMAPGRAFRVGEDPRRGLPVEKQFDVIDGRKVLLEFLPLSRVQRELRRARRSAETAAADPRPSQAAGAKETLLAAGIRSGNQRLVLPPQITRLAKSTDAVRRVAALRVREGFVADWDYVEYGGDFDAGTDCGTWVVQGEYHLNSATFRPGATVKLDPGGSLWVDGPFYWNSSSSCPAAPAVITSTSDDANGETIPWSCGSPAQGEFGPALAVSSSDLATALSHLTVYYAQPGIVPNPMEVSAVMVAATDSQAIKGTADYGVFTLTRSGWDESDPLTINFSMSGTAVAGSDYASLGASATIPASEDSVTITNVPLSPNGSAYRSSIILSIQPSNTYAVGTPSVAQGSIYDPTAPDPATATVPANIVSWWRGETNALDSVSTNHGTAVGGAGYGPGMVGQSLSLTNDSGAFDIGVPLAIEIQNFSIEAWVRRSSADYVSYYPDTDALLLSCGWAGWGFGLSANGRPLLSQIGYNSLCPNISITDTNWHHVAITKTNSVVLFYVDGVSYPASCYGSTFSTGMGMAIGAVGEPWAPNSFEGQIDELSFYNRVLSAGEVQGIFDADWAGKLIDSDSNGLPDSWEMHYFGHIGVDPNADPDGDGLTNLQEFQQRTNPTKQDSNGDGVIDQAFKVIVTRPSSASNLP